jgi:hypothetical protein
VTLRDEDLQVIAMRRKAFIEARAHDIRLVSMHFYVATTCETVGANVQFYGATVEIARGAETVQAWAFLGERTYVALANDEQVISQPAWSAILRVIIREDGVQWYAGRNARGDASATTVQVLYEDLFAGKL